MLYSYKLKNYSAATQRTENPQFFNERHIALAWLLPNSK